MRAVVQRVLSARVTVNGQVTGEIGKGCLVFLGIATDDTQEDVNSLAAKLCGLRIFEDADGKMNLTITEASGAMLIVSQFTLYGDCRKGRRPSFVNAARPELAQKLYQSFIAEVRGLGVPVETGRFQEHMNVELNNDGPVTLLLDSRKLF